MLQKNEPKYNPKSVIFSSVLALLLIVKIIYGLLSPQGHVSFASDLTIENILQAVNEQRSLRNLVTLNTNNKLGLAAQSKADDMQGRHYFAHVDPDGHYIWDKITADGYSPYLQLGENLAIEFYDTDSLVSAWMNSPTHRANLLNDGFRDQGMGLTFGDSQSGQYHSAIANTFGTLAVSAQPKTSAPASAPKTPAKKPTPQTLGSSQTQTKTPAPKPVPAPVPAKQTPPPVQTQQASESPQTTLSQPITPRQAPLLAVNGQPDFTLPSGLPASSSEKQLITPAPAAPTDYYLFSDYQTNRYLILICGIVLLLFLLSDIKKSVENKLGSLDKKTNNLVMLVMALIVIAFMYWF